MGQRFLCKGRKNRLLRYEVVGSQDGDVKTTLITLTQTTLLSALAFGATFSMAAEDWKDKTIAPVANPLFFEAPQITSEVRPIFIYHTIDKSFLTGGGDVEVYAMQLRYAVNDRLSIIATKDGYIDFNPKGVLPHKDGWADLAAGVKYAVVDDAESQFLLTPGLKFEIPTGNERVFQGNGKGEWNVFLSALKGFGDFHATGSVGVRLPNDMDAETAQLHYSLQLDYYLHQYFIPFVAVNAFTVISEGNVLPLDVEGFDLINFGSSAANGRTQATLAGGFRSRITNWADLGFAYEGGITTPRGLFDNRVTVDFIFRF